MNATRTTQTESSSDAYRWDEEEWFAERDLPGHDDQDEPDRDWGHAHEFVDGTDQAAWAARGLFKSWAPKLCAATLKDDPDRGWASHMAAEGLTQAPGHDPLALHAENREVELSAPTFTCPKDAPDHVATGEYGQYRVRRRLNEETGYVSFGETTGVYLQDIPTPQFLNVVDEALELYDAAPQERADLRGFAERQKRDGGQRDVDILEAVIARLAE